MVLQLNNLTKLNKARKRVGRGGDLGGTSGRGHKGQKARSGGLSKLGFEGGQMPLTRRLPKRGFKSSCKHEIKVVNLVDLESKFSSGDTINHDSLVKKGIIKRLDSSVKILGKGKLTKKLIVYADLFSKSAQDAIVNAGGEAKLNTRE